MAKKPRKTRRSKVVGRCTSETLQASSIWGQIMSDIQLEIVTSGVNPDSELHTEDFSSPFSSTVFYVCGYCSGMCCWQYLWY